MEMIDYGFTPEMMNHCAGGIPGRVIAVHRERYCVVCPEGEVFSRLKAGQYYTGQESFPTVGDFVCLNCIPNGDSLILSTLPSRTYFARRIAFGR